MLQANSFGLPAVALAAAVCLLTLSDPVIAQSTPTMPRGEVIPFNLDTGWLNNPANVPTIVFSQIVQTPGSAWTRIYFSQMRLERGSFVRMTSLHDGESQQLDALSAAVWSNSSAYFNGDAVLVELIAAPGTRDNRIVINELAVEFDVPHATAGSSGQCGICGADNRTPSNELWTGRLMPSGCTAAVYSACSCLVSAGHCWGGPGSVIEFNVPSSLSDCTLVHPPVADQFPVTGYQGVNGGVGNDWSVMTTGVNSLGQTAVQRYGEVRPIIESPAPNNGAISVWGFGTDNVCVNSNVQQLSAGNINSVGSSYYAFIADIRPGNSGSPLVYNQQIIGVVTHCNVNCPNLATRTDRPEFAQARATLCPCAGGGCAADIVPPNGDGAVNIHDLLAVLMNWGPCSSSLSASFVGGSCTADVAPPGGDGLVDVTDALTVIANWGPCE